MRVFAFSSQWALIFIIKLFTCVLVRLGSHNLSSDVMRKVAIHAILTIASEVVNTWVLVSFHMIPGLVLALFRVIFGTLAFIDCKVLFWAEGIDSI